MKKILIAVFAVALPVIASAQVGLMSGYNFGQFLGGGYPSLDGTSFEPVGSVGSNFRLNSQAPASSDGGFVGANGTTGNYSNGSGRIYWDGTNGSSNYDYSGGVQIVATDLGGTNTVNGQTVQGYTIAAQGDSLNLGLTSNLAGGRIAFVQNTTGFTDFDPGSYVNGPGVASDANLTFAAAVSAPVTVNWYLNGSASSFASTVLSGGLNTYSLDLDAAFYGLTNATLVAEFSGLATLDNVQFNGVAIPEPSTYAAILGAVTLGVAALRRRRSANVSA